jgi:hypothetical protein
MNYPTQNADEEKPSSNARGSAQQFRETDRLPWFGTGGRGVDSRFY